MLVTTMVMESIENLSSPHDSTTSTMRDINATRHPLPTRCCSATRCLDGTSTRRRIRDACLCARLANTVVHLAAPPSARRPLKTHSANKCAGITRCMTRRHSHTCSGCAKPFTFRANNCSWCVKPSNISRQLPFQMREVVIHFAPTLFRLQKGTFRVISHSTKTVYFISMNIRLHSPPEANGTFFRLHFQPQGNSPILGQPRRHIYSIFYIHTCCHLPFFWAVAIALFVIRLKCGQSPRPLILIVYSDISKSSTPNYTVFQPKFF